jgi:hypothetical protein
MEQPISPAAAQIKIPAIGLLVTGITNLLLGLLGTLSAVLRLAGFVHRPSAPRSNDVLMDTPYQIGEMFAQLIFFLTLITAPFIIKGAVDMLKGRKLASAKTAAILAMIPMTSCCLLLGAPLGLWALLVLSKPEVKAFFETGHGDFSPPPPPQYP